MSGWHDGYKRLKGRPVHHREFHWDNSARLTVRDRTTASKSQKVVSRIHLHPSCEIDRVENDSVRVSYPNGEFRITLFGGGRLSLEDSYYCPEFGIKIPNKAVAYASSGCKTETEFQIEEL